MRRTKKPDAVEWDVIWDKGKPEVPEGFSWVTLLYRTEKDMRLDKAEWVAVGWTVHETKDLQATYSYPDEEPPIVVATGESAVLPVGSS